MRCECGCGYRGEDEIAQYLIEEACMTALEMYEAASDAAAAEQAHKEQAVRAAQEHVARELAALEGT